MYTELKTEFTTADADYPSFRFVDNDIVVSFTDWQGQIISMIFNDTAGFAWQSIEDSFEMAPDRIYEVDRITLCPEIRKAKRQIRICFNACFMCFDVQFSSFQIQFDQ